VTVSLSVSLSLCYAAALCENGAANRGPVQGGDTWGYKAHLDGGPDPLTSSGVRCGLCQNTSCFIRVNSLRLYNGLIAEKLEILISDIPYSIVTLDVKLYLLIYLL